MKIDSYQVGFGVRHESLGVINKNIDVSETKTDLQNGKAKSVERVESTRKNENSVDAELSMKLQAAMMERLQERNRKVVYQSIKAEYEELSFQTKAIIKAEGKEMSVDLQANLKRSFVVNEKMILDEIIVTDPLVISLDGNMPQLGKTTFEFDIDSDGQKDQISNLRYGSGFLALDKNENGKIDNGSELFGTQSGDGFRDLKAYDDDGNGWIDENDKIFDKLRIWQKTDGEDKLVGIGEVGIGAIFLGNATTDFTYKSLEENQTQGQMRSSGFFMFENGKAGVMSQIDLRKFSNESEENKMVVDIKKMLENSQDTNKRVVGLGIYTDQSKKINATNSSKGESIIDKLKAKIQQLKAKLAKANPKEANLLQSQIINLNAQIMTLSKMGFS